MSLEAILAAIAAEAEAEAERVIARAQAEAAALADGAQRTADARVAEARVRAEPAIRAEAVRLENAARLRLLEGRAEAAAARTAAVFRAADEELAAIAEGSNPDRWRVALGRLVSETAPLVGGAASAVVRPCDLEAVRQAAKPTGWTVVADDGVAPGLVVRSVDGHVEVDATLRARAARARARLAEPVAHRLGLSG